FASADVECLAEGGDDCHRNGEPPYSGPREDKFYQLSNGLSCLWKNQEFHCVERVEDRFCLIKNHSNGDVDSSVLQVDDEDYPVTQYERHDKCQSIAGLIKVGTNIQIHKSINLRSTPGGALLGVVPV